MAPACSSAVARPRTTTAMNNLELSFPIVVDVEKKKMKVLFKSQMRKFAIGQIDRPFPDLTTDNLDL
jgi:hypothetical protein